MNELTPQEVQELIRLDEMITDSEEHDHAKKLNKNSDDLTFILNNTNFEK